MPEKALVHRLDHLLPQVVNGRGDLFQIAAPDNSSKAAKQEIRMIELRKFQLPASAGRSRAFDFERASLALLTRHQHRRTKADSLPVRRFSRDPGSFLCDTIGEQGANHHG